MGVEEFMLDANANGVCLSFEDALRCFFFFFIFPLRISLLEGLKRMKDVIEKGGYIVDSKKTAGVLFCFVM